MSAEDSAGMDLSKQEQKSEADNPYGATQNSMQKLKEIHNTTDGLLGGDYEFEK